MLMFDSIISDYLLPINFIFSDEIRIHLYNLKMKLVIILKRGLLINYYIASLIGFVEVLQYSIYYSTWLQWLAYSHYVDRSVTRDTCKTNINLEVHTGSTQQHYIDIFSSNWSIDSIGDTCEITCVLLHIKNE